MKIEQKNNLSKKSIKEIDTIFSIFNEIEINPRIELKYKTPYQLLVSVILSARSTDIQVNKITDQLFEKIATPEEMIDLGKENLKNYIKFLGLYNNKANNIIVTSHMLIENFKSEVPNNIKDLLSLPGIGTKSAKVILNVIFGESVIAVDTHVFRTSNRIGLCSTKTPIATEIALESIIPKKWLNKVHHWLVLHGRYICKARKPLCEKCPIRKLCNYYNSIFIN
ncbi:endonuclease III [Lyticum sinuosum]|uniref:Endonuclease III n=1 Tax=Lyticum sinuosum TaxID=1332059 RepID=A0AAE4VM35_9RICK|nr:endonuclease III [Lyticum sinuosum]MDZ5761411.1 Endonuclease III [Lyticum sinuosum]